MPAREPAIHGVNTLLRHGRDGVDARIKFGHDTNGRWHA